MRRVSYTVPAEQDLRQIVEYIAQDNLTAAIHWLDDMEALFDLLCKQPQVGERMTTRRCGEVRRHSKGEYVVYYRIADDGLQVLRVLHGARDLGDLV